MIKPRSHQEFIEELRAKGLLDNLNVLTEYKNAHTKIIVENNLGKFEIGARNLLEGTKPCLRNSINKKQYIDNFIKNRYGFDYGFEKFEYKGIKSKATFICPYHGEFTKLVDSIIQGKGCRVCAYSRNSFRHSDWKNMCPGSPGILYLIHCFYEDEEFYKIGITCKSVEERYRYYMPYLYYTKYQLASYDREFILREELRLKKYLRDCRHTPTFSFDGSYTECFRISDYTQQVFKNNFMFYEK